MNLLKKSFIQLHKYHFVILQCLLALGIFLFATYRLSETGQPIIFNDEIGYWSNCNFLIGKNWMPVTNRIAYYSYGYSLLLIPIRLLGMLRGWHWSSYYHAGIVLNAMLLVLSFFLAQKIAKRYLPDMDRYVRLAACAVVFVYPSTVMYAHITWSECTLLAFVWILLYVMMRVIDAPGIGNHAAFAGVAFYLFAVHQRSLGIVLSTVLIVLYLRLLGRNRLIHAYAYAAALYVCYLLHTMFKGYVQNANYLGGEKGGIRQFLGYAANKKSLVFLGLILVVFVFLYLLEKRKTGILVLFVLAGAAAAVGYLRYRGGIPGFEVEENRLSINDFSGQLWKVTDLLSWGGRVRTGVSIVGKWFYMASGSALVVCFSLWALFKNAVVLAWKHIKQPFVMHRQKCSAAEYCASAMSGEEWKDRIWFLGIFMIWFSTFMISALYKAGLFKNDDLLNGRYIDFIFGFLMIYGLYCLLKDKYWIISSAIFAGMYLAAGWLCQDILDKLKRTDFELAHCVLFGRVIWNYAPPYGKIDLIVKYVLQISLVFILIVKLGTGERVHGWLRGIGSRLGSLSAVQKLRGRIRFLDGKKLIRWDRWLALRVIIALIIPLYAWGYIGKEEVDKYVVVRNEKQEKPFVRMTNLITILGNSKKNIYYLMDYANDRYCGAIQFMLPNHTVTLAGVGQLDFKEDAFYIIRDKVKDEPVIVENCEIVYSDKGYSLLVSKNGSLYDQWLIYKK